MSHQNASRKKIQMAEDILARCLGTKGVWADSTRYREQCWTRDFALAILPLLLERKQYTIAKTHLENLSERVRDNGQVPILFLDHTLPFLADKIMKSFRSRKISFMLKRWLSGNLWNLTPGTRDSEIAYLIAIHEYDVATNKHSLLTKQGHTIKRVLSYIDLHLKFDGLVQGCDWRDTMHLELADKLLLTNNSMMYHVSMLMHNPKAHWLKERINLRFWNGTSYQDAPDRPRFDPLGGSLAVLYGVIPSERYASVVRSFHEVDSPNGVTIKCKHNPLNAEEQEIIDRTDGVVVWPFIVGFTILALIKMGEMEFAEEQFRKLCALKDFREWYDPESGTGCGAQEQLWSATLFLRCVNAFEREQAKTHP